MAAPAAAEYTEPSLTGSLNGEGGEDGRGVVSILHGAESMLLDSVLDSEGYVASDLVSCGALNKAAPVSQEGHSRAGRWCR